MLLSIIYQFMYIFTLIYTLLWNENHQFAGGFDSVTPVAGNNSQLVFFRSLAGKHFIPFLPGALLQYCCRA